MLNCINRTCALTLSFIFGVFFAKTSLHAMEVSNIHSYTEATACVEATLKKFNITAIDTIRNALNGIDYVAYNQQGDRIRVSCWNKDYNASTRPHNPELGKHPETLYKLLAVKYTEQQQKLKNK